MRIYENQQILTTSPYNNWFWSFEGSVWPEELQELTNLCEQYQKIDAVVDSKTQPDTLIRSTKVAWIDNQQVYDFIKPFFENANVNSGWNFDITAIEQVQYTVYNSDEKDHYSWHTDTIVNDRYLKETEGVLAGTVRKLSCVVQLSSPSEYEGGDFQFLSGINRKYLEQDKNVFDVEPLVLDESLKDKGTILFFPSFSYHRVTPITRGTRRSLVFWFRGPNWI